MINMRFEVFWENITHGVAYHVWTFLGLKPNDQGHGHIYIILSDIVPIFGRWVPLALVNNVATRSFQFLRTKKSFSIFHVKEMSFFMKQVWTIWHRIPPPQFSHKVDNVLWIIPKFYVFSSFLANFTHLNDFMSIYQK